MSGPTSFHVSASVIVVMDEVMLQVVKFLAQLRHLGPICSEQGLTLGIVGRGHYGIEGTQCLLCHVLGVTEIVLEVDGALGLGRAARTGTIAKLVPGYCNRVCLSAP